MAVAAGSLLLGFSLLARQAEAYAESALPVRTLLNDETDNNSG
jgi:hypothetical protein